MSFFMFKQIITFPFRLTHEFFDIETIVSHLILKKLLNL